MIFRILVEILDRFMQVKINASRHQKKTVDQVVSSSTSRQQGNFLLIT